MTVLARREGRDTGVWIWLLGMPMLFAMPVLRFDIMPTVIGMAAIDACVTLCLTLREPPGAEVAGIRNPVAAERL